MRLMGSERSLARGLEVAVRIAWILGIAGGVFLVAIPIFVVATSDGTTYGPPLPVSIRGGFEGLEIVQPRSDDITDARLVVEEALLDFRPAGGAVWAWSWVAGLVAYGLAMLVVHRLMKIIGTLTAGRPFTHANAVRIRTIGLAVTGLWCFNLVLRLASAFFAQRNFVLEHGSFTWVVDMNLALLFLGLLIVVLGEVFRIGAALQDDHDATI